MATLKGIASELEEYHLTINPEYLDSLYADQTSPNEYPAVLLCSSGTSDCFVRFRGRSTMQYPKKSWAINLCDPELLGRDRLNLNSEYTDPGMMRNCIAMRTSQLMGLPGSETSHVKLYVNGEYYGVYLDVERVDSYYFQNRGYDPLVTFKAHEQTARFMPLPSGTDYEFVYQPRADSEVNISLLINFIDCINAGVSPLPLDEFNILGYYAVNLALVEMDSGSNNYYLTMGQDRKWRIFPWDRGICLGGGGNGVFYPGFHNDTYLELFRENSLYQRLIASPSSMVLFDEYLTEVTELLSFEIPLLLDSIYNNIKIDLYEDPMSPWSVEEIDQGYADLVWFVNERAQFLADNHIVPETGEVIELEISNAWLEPGEGVIIRVAIDNPFLNATLMWLADSESFFKSMTPVQGFERYQWLVQFIMPPGVDHCPLSFYFNRPTGQKQFFSYPAYGLSVYPYVASSHPSIVRLTPGTSPPASNPNCDFIINSPEVCGPNLWFLPLVNISETDIDISCCVFVFGNSPNRIVIQPGTVISAGDTLFLTNSLNLFQSEFPGKVAFGNCASPSPNHATLTMLDPCWNDLWTRPVAPYQDIQLPPSAILVTELNFMNNDDFNCGDWVEFYNPTDSILNIGGYILSDSQGNQCMVPINTTIESGGFIVLVREFFLFQSSFPSCNSAIDGLGFGFDSQSDILRVSDRSGTELFCITWNSFDFQTADSPGVLSLVSPVLPLQDSNSWELAPFPGSPGEPNRLWNAGGESLNLTAVYPNPLTAGTISFDYTTKTWPVRLLIMDLTGRIVLNCGILEEADGRYSLDMPENASAGIYFIVLQSAGIVSVKKFTLL